MCLCATASLICAMVLCAVILSGCPNEDVLKSREDIQLAVSSIEGHATGWMIASILLALCTCCFGGWYAFFFNSRLEESRRFLEVKVSEAEREFFGPLCIGSTVFLAVLLIIALLCWWINGGLEAHFRSRTCGNFMLFGAEHCSMLRTGMEDMYGWSPRECCDLYYCSCDLFSQVQLTTQSYIKSDCCMDLESCSSYDCGSDGVKKVPEPYCLESGCAREQCCVPLKTCDNYTGCIRSDERILNKFCDANGCTRETCCQTSPYTRPCLCNATGAGLYCETGEGEECKTASDIDSLWSCFTSQTLCVFENVCHPRPGISGGCQQYKTRESCEGQVHCHYEEDTALVHSWSCQGVQEGALTEYCSTVTTKEACDTQEMCSWNLTQSEQSCKNQGQWMGCTEKTETAAARCRSHAHARDECILNSDICNWVGSCECGPDHFGRDCSKELVELNSQVPQGFCTQEQANLSICRGFVYASSSADRHLCGREGTQCGPWQEVKDAVASIREAEIGDIIVDSLGIIFLMVAAGFRFAKFNKYVFFASLANFLADIILEVRLVTVSAKAIEAVATVRGSFCFSYGDGIASLVKLEDLVDSIVTYAWTNIGLAIFGSLCELLDTFLQYHNVEQVSTGTLLLVVGTAVSELGVGAASFSQNTQELIAEIESMESAALGLAGFDEGHACFVRSSDADLPSTALIGVEWDSVGFLIVPPLLVSIFYIVTTCLIYYNGSGHKD